MRSVVISAAQNHFCQFNISLQLFSTMTTIALFYYLDGNK